VSDDSPIKLSAYRPTELEAADHLAAAVHDLRQAGCSAAVIVRALLYAAYDAEAEAQGAAAQAEGWADRADLSFQRAVAGFCVETTNAELTEDGGVRLPCNHGVWRDRPYKG
jgi:hypothetical protein